MKIFYEDDDLIISDTGIVVSGSQTSVRQIKSWTTDRNTPFYRSPDPMDLVFIRVVLKSFHPKQILGQQKKVGVATFFNSFVVTDSLGGFLELMQKRRPDWSPSEIKKGFAEERRRYTKIVRALDLMLAAKPA